MNETPVTAPVPTPPPAAIEDKPRPTARGLLRRIGSAAPDIVLIGLIVIGVVFRFSWTDWSEGTNLAPDEYGLTNTLSQLSMPKSFDEWFNTRLSPMSPYQKYDLEGNPTVAGPDNGMVWGQWPQIVIRATAEGVTGAEQKIIPAVTSLQAKVCPAPVEGTSPGPACTPPAFVRYTDYDPLRLLGRTLSALFDSITLLVCFLIGLELYNRRIALLGTALSALAVMQIQQSHFMTVDNFAVTFAVLAVFCAVRVAKKGGWAWYPLFGVFYGMTLASKINLVPIGAAIAIAAWMGNRERWQDRARTLAARFGPAAGGMALAVALTLLTFRVTQPMSFRAATGDTTIFTLRLNPEWSSNMQHSQQLSSGVGAAGYPPADQWANRTPILFPLTNMVLWGMGLPLGLAACIGFAWAAYGIFRKREWERHLLPVAIAGGMFLFLGTRWVMSVRYFLIVYPFFCLLAAWALLEFWKLASARRWLRAISGAALGLVVLGTLLWAWGFTSIYRNENTRVAASRWVFQNVAAPFNIELTTAGGTVQEPIAFYSGQQIVTDPTQIHFQPREDGTLSGIRLGFALGTYSPAILHVEILDSTGVISSADVEIPAPGADPRGEPASANLPAASLVEGGDYTLSVSAVAGGPISVSGSTIADETWDEALPVRVDGRDAFGGLYSGITMDMEWPDVPDKLDMIVTSLTNSDYVILPSQRRVWTSIRMPAAYPMTTAYYQALFDGRLGYDLAAEFQSPIIIGPLEVSDLAAGAAIGHAPALPVVNLNPLSAEEAFSVYDHAPVWIFHKRADFNPDQVRAVLGAIDLTEVGKQDASQSAGVLNGLMLSSEQEATQQAGGTWSEMFSYSWIWNQYPGIAVVIWWLWAVVTGWAALPIVSRVFRGLPDEGYSLAKIAGWLLVTWAAWLLGSLQVPFVWTTIAVLWLALLAAGGLMAWREREHWRESFHKLWKTWLTMEIVFAAFFVFDLLIRLGNADLWHPSKGGEKPMDFSYLNAVIKSTTFPAYDPWFSGGYLNYYYFGFVLDAIPIKLLGTVPSIAYNIVLPTLFATIGVTGYGVAWNLTESLRRKGQMRVSPFAAGIGAAVMLVVLGNLGEVSMVWTGLVQISTLSIPHGLFFGIGDLVHALDGLWLVLSRQGALPYGLDSWYWNASRIIPVPINPQGIPTEIGPITEFPFFTFLYADLHAHMMAMPLMLLSLGGAAAMVISPGLLRSWKTSLPLIAFLALATGSLWPTNAWNYPVSLGIALLALIVGGWRMLAESAGVLDWRGWLRILVLGGLLAGLSVLFYQPFYYWYGAGYNAFDPWKGSKTPASAYFGMFGLFLFIMASYLIWQTRDWLAETSFESLRKVRGIGEIILFSAALLGAGMVILAVQGYEVLFIAVPLAIWAALIGIRRGLADEHRVICGLIAIGLLITCVVELVVLKGDGDRMNTVFKFYIQAWIFFAIAAGVGLGWLAGELGQWKWWARRIWIVLLSLLAVGAFYYTIQASITKITDRMSDKAPRTLDGITYMPYSQYGDNTGWFNLEEDYAAIRWMQENVQGSPVIVEAHTVEYNWGNRFTIYTGLPSVIGWNWHQRQQRGVVNDQWVWDRVNAVADFYNSADSSVARTFLRRYDVRYVIVGQLERNYYTPEGIAKFESMAAAGELKAVFSVGNTTVYEVENLLP